jgi:glycopeptide antibiotics resistance protein
MTLFRPKSWNKNRTLNIIFFCYLLTLLVLLLMPTDNGIQLNAFFLGVRTDHFIHASLFLPFMPYFRLKLIYKNLNANFFKYYLLGILFALSFESLQLLVPYRSFDPTDIVANIVGISIGGLTFLWKSKTKKD